MFAQGYDRAPGGINQAAEASVDWKVLIVEDTIELAEIVQATLRRIGLDAAYETHGHEAVARYDALQPDLLLLDLALPDTTGWKVLETIRQHKEKDHAPKVIIITAYGDPANRLMGKLQDVDGYLVKPLKPDDVETVVRRVLGLDAT